MHAINHYCKMDMPEKPTLFYGAKSSAAAAPRTSRVRRRALLQQWELPPARCALTPRRAPRASAEFHTDSDDVAEATEAIATDNGGAGFEYATRAEDRTRLWHARHNAYYAAQSIRTGERIQGFPTDVCVPISELAGSILETKRDLEENNIIAPIVGHVGDGNYHCLCLVDIDDADEVRRWQVRRWPRLRLGGAQARGGGD